MNKWFLVASLLFSAFVCQSRSMDYYITSYGAKKDTSVLSTKAIQKAIDDCAANGGGYVVVPAGSFKTGSIFLRDNVYLYLSPGAVLYGSRSCKDYIPVQPKYVAYKTGRPTIQLIYGESITNSGILGEGTIDGQGAFFRQNKNFGDELISKGEDDGVVGGRPHLIRFITCRNITVKGVSLRSSPCWLQHYLACDNVCISGLKIFNRATQNNDAIDIDGCRNVVISDIISDTEDDGITLKSTSPRATENVTITNCTVSSQCNAIKLGTETNGGFKNITISNCVIKPSYIPEPKPFNGIEGGLAGLALEIEDGGILEGVTISNIVVRGTQAPIFIRLGCRSRSWSKDVKIEHVGQLRNVSISNVQALDVGHVGCSITGIPGHRVENITLRDVYIELAGNIEGKTVVENPAERERDYPECTMFTGWNHGKGLLPSKGFFVRHAKNVRFENVRIHSRVPDERPDFVFQDVISDER